MREQVGSFDELLSSILQAGLARLTVSENEDMRKISAWAFRYASAFPFPASSVTSPSANLTRPKSVFLSARLRARALRKMRCSSPSLLALTSASALGRATPRSVMIAVT